MRLCVIYCALALSSHEGSDRVDTNTFVLVAVSAIFVMVGVLAWLVDAGLSSKAKVRVRYSLFAMFAVVFGSVLPDRGRQRVRVRRLGALKERDWRGSWQRSFPRRWRSGWSGRRRWRRWRRRLFRGSGFFIDEDETTEEQASGDGTIQDCPKCPEIEPTKTGRGLIGSTSKVAIKGAELGPAKSVAFGRDFGIGKYEVTVVQFKAFVKEAE